MSRLLSRLWTPGSWFRTEASESQCEDLQEGNFKEELERLSTSTPGEWEGRAWRMHHSRYPADDPGGAFRYSGRYHRGRDLFDEDDVFPALYLATAPEVALGEKQRHLTSGNLPQMRSQVLSELHLSLQAVFDLSMPEEIGASSEALMDDHDSKPCVVH